MCVVPLLIINLLLIVIVKLFSECRLIYRTIFTGLLHFSGIDVAPERRSIIDAGNRVLHRLSVNDRLAAFDSFNGVF